MPDHFYRYFADDAAIRRIGEGLLACTLPKLEWTHEAHLGATTWLLRDRPDVDVNARIPGIISAYNASTGGVNDAKQGYHETITRCFVAGIRLHLKGRDPAEPLHHAVNALIDTPMGRHDWPMHFYTRDRLFTSEARLAFIPPDLQPLP